MLALVDNTGAEVTVLHRDFNGKEAAPQSTEIPALLPSAPKLRLL